MCAHERTVGGQAGAHHWCGFIAGDVLWDLEGEVFVGADVAGVSTLGDGSVGVGGIVGICTNR